MPGKIINALSVSSLSANADLVLGLFGSMLSWVLKVNNGAITGYGKTIQKELALIGNKAKLIFLLYAFIVQRLRVMNSCWKPGFIVHLPPV